MWRQCEAENGGGIYLKADSTVSLTVNKGEFDSCKADPYRGGGIYVEGIGNMKIEDTLFLGCTAEAQSHLGGGGIEITSPQKSPQIHRCLFLRCTSQDDAGGIGIWSSPLDQEMCILCCCLIECQNNHATDSVGGGIAVWYSSAAFGCSNCLFLRCHSAFIGGAFAYNIKSSQKLTSKPLSSFSFFHMNTAKEHGGNDAYFVEWTPTTPFMHSFSTSSPYRITIGSSSSTWNNVNFYTHSDSWLPQGIVTYA